MSLFDVFTLLGGLAFFIFGMGVMSQGLEKSAGSKLESAIKIMTESRLKGILLGTAVTAAVQSSSAITVMLVGFANSGIMSLSQCTGIIIGSNIGTTLTPWIMSLTGLESTSFIIRFFQPSSLMPLAALAGVMALNLIKNEKIRNLGSALIGFSILMYGMEMMSSSAMPLTESKHFEKAVNLLSNPFLGLVAGTVITGIVQSSAATIGILQAISASGAIPYSTAIPIIMGQNIGTCVTAAISSIGTTKNAKRVAVIHMNFNLIGSVIFLAVYLIADSLFRFRFSSLNITPTGIAAFHTVFNILSAILLYPFSTQMEKLANIIIKESGAKHTAMHRKRKDKKMKNLFSVLIVLLITASVFTACTKNESDQPETLSDAPLATEAASEEVSPTYPANLTAIGAANSKNDFIFETVDLDGESKQFIFYTNCDILSDALGEAEMLSLNKYTSEIESVNGIHANYNADGMRWVLYINGEKAEKLCNEITIAKANTYSFRLER